MPRPLPTALTLTLTLALLLALAAHPSSALWPSDPARDPDAVLLADVRSLVLKRGQRTSARRSRSVPQLHCVGGPCSPENEPEVVLCEQVGVDYTTTDPLWKCSATLPAGLRLGVTDVSCEGYRFAEDPYILRGSCGLEFTIVGTPAATTTTTTTAANQPQQTTRVREVHHVHHYDQPAAPTLSSWFAWSRKEKPATAARIDVVTRPLPLVEKEQHRSSSSSWWGWLFWGALAWALYRWYSAPSRANIDQYYYSPPRHTAPHSSTSTTTTTSWPAGERGWHNANNWRGWNNWSAWKPAPAATREYEAKQAGYVPERTPGNPGFWGGAGLGALAGYWLGTNRGAAYERHRRRSEAPYTGVYDRGPFENQPVAPATALHPGQPATVIVQETIPPPLPPQPPQPPPAIESAGFGTTKRR